MKKVIIFGANGRTGKELCSQVLAKGFEVNAFVRNAEKLILRHQNLNIVQGDILHYNEVAKAIENQDVVCCCIGAPASDESGIREKGTENIVNAMQEHGVKRLICLSSLGFGDSRAILPWYMKYIIVPFILKKAFADHANQEKVIEQSNLDWTIARPANLTDGPLTGQYKQGFGNDELIKLKISRADVAHFMANQLGSDKYLHRKVGLSY